MQTTDLVAQVVASFKKRSYWRLRFHDGKTISEWDADWADVPRKSRVALRLYCPNGQIAEVGNSEDASDRLFQFKIAEIRATPGKVDRGTLAQVIGIVTSTDGTCTCYAWNYRTKQIDAFEDNVFDFKYENVGPLNPDIIGVGD